jgi:hypothetical protein
MYKHILLYFALSQCFTLVAQIERDQDLITLKNGYQYLGYVIEQQPGKLIKLYRPQENDTIPVALSDVAKLSKIWTKSFSEKKIEETDTVVFTGRFNNKRHVFQIGYQWHWRDIESKERGGLALGWHRSFHNKFLLGAQALFFGRQNPQTRYGNYAPSEQRHQLMHYHFLLSSAYRLGRPYQNSRVSAWFFLNTGYIIDRSNSTYVSTEPLGVGFEEAEDSWTLQTSVAFRINPDAQSGFAIEPGFAFYPQTRSLYTSEPDTPNSIFLGTRREEVSLFTLKVSYFF